MGEKASTKSVKNVQEKIYKEIEKNKVNTVSIEENIKELKKIENMHLLIKRKGGDFNLTNEELELVEKLT